MNSDKKEINWYHAQYRFKHPAEQWIDIFLIETFAEMVFPLLSNKEPWRFHRRSNNDEALHQLTFYYRCDKELHDLVRENLSASWQVNKLKKENLLIEENYAEICGVLWMTSDPNWPFEIQYSWPFFIKGVCEMFVLLIPSSEKMKQYHHLSSSPLTIKSELFEISETYRIKNQLLRDMYKDWGCHAFFHHISSVFGGPQVNITLKEIVGVI